MIKPGTMRKVKKVLGGALALMAFGFAFDVPEIQNLVMDLSYVSISIVIASSYFLIKSGARK